MPIHQTQRDNLYPESQRIFGVFKTCDIRLSTYKDLYNRCVFFCIAVNFLRRLHNVI